MVRASFPSFVLREFHLHRDLRGAEGCTREQNMEFLPSTGRVGSQEERRGLSREEVTGWKTQHSWNIPLPRTVFCSFDVATASDVTNGPE